MASAFLERQLSSTRAVRPRDCLRDAVSRRAALVGRVVHITSSSWLSIVTVGGACRRGWGGGSRLANGSDGAEGALGALYLDRATDAHALDRLGPVSRTVWMTFHERGTTSRVSVTSSPSFDRREPPQAGHAHGDGMMTRSRGRCSGNGFLIGSLRSNGATLVVLVVAISAARSSSLASTSRSSNWSSICASRRRLRSALEPYCSRPRFAICSKPYSRYPRAGRPAARLSAIPRRPSPAQTNRPFSSRLA